MSRTHLKLTFVSGKRGSFERKLRGERKRNFSYVDELRTVCSRSWTFSGPKGNLR